MMLAACGKVVTIHEWPDRTVIGGVSCTNDVSTFKGLSWSYLGNKLLVVPTVHPPILLQAYNDEEIVDDVFWMKALKGLSCSIESGIFSNKFDRYVTVSLPNGDLITCDTFCEDPPRNHAALPEPIHFLDYSHSDTLLAAGCRSGQIYFYDDTGIMNTSLKVPFSNSLSAMMFHPHSDSYIVAGGNEGVLAAWDVNTAIIRFQNQNHRDTISGICMITDEEQLISVSLDKTVLFYDLRTHVTVNTFSSDVELTAVAYLKGNEDILVGTYEGRIMCLDRRKPTVLKYSFESQKNSPIKCISFTSRSCLEPKCTEEPNCLSTAKENIPQSVTSIIKPDDHVQSDDNNSISTDDERSETFPFQVVAENHLKALTQEIINIKEIMQNFVDVITEQLQNVHMEVSRAFSHLEQIQIMKWNMCNNMISKLKARAMLNRKMSEGSESNNEEPAGYDAKRDEFEKKPRN